MAKYIDANKAIKHLKSALPHAEDTDEAERVIRNMTTADVQEVKHGRWIDVPQLTYDYMECSVCGHQREYEDYMHYCPNCGAKMEEDK